MSESTDRDDVERLLNLLMRLTDDIDHLTDDEVAEELAAMAPMVPSLREIIEQALAKHDGRRS